MVCWVLFGLFLWQRGLVVVVVAGWHVMVQLFCWQNTKKSWFCLYYYLHGGHTRHTRIILDPGWTTNQDNAVLAAVEFWLANGTLLRIFAENWLILVELIAKHIFHLHGTPWVFCLVLGHPHHSNALHLAWSPPRHHVPKLQTCIQHVQSNDKMGCSICQYILHNLLVPFQKYAVTDVIQILRIDLPDLCFVLDAPCFHWHLLDWECVRSFLFKQLFPWWVDVTIMNLSKM